METNPGQMSQTNRENATGYQFGQVFGDVNIYEGTADLPENLYPSVTSRPAPPVPESWQGRVQELQQLHAWLDDKGVLLAGIYGVGGYGKSTLAAKVMREAEGFAGRFWGDVSGGMLFSVLARQALGEFLQLSPQQVERRFPEENLATALVGCLRESRVLLVLDNLESLVRSDLGWRDEGYEQFLSQWLGGYGGESLVLVTSQVRPQLPGAVRWLELSGLTREEGMRLLLAEGAVGTEAELQEFSELVDGCPLALRLVVGMLRDEEGGESLPLAHFWRYQLEPLQAQGYHRGEKLSTEMLLAASFGQLAEKLRRALLGASVYREAFTLAAVRAQLPGEEISEAEWGQLLRRCLVQRQDEGEEWRYQFQPLVLRYLQGLATEREEAHRRAIGYFESVAQADGWQVLADVQAYLEMAYHRCQLGEHSLAFAAIRTCNNFLDLRGYNAVRQREYEQLRAGWQPQTREERWQYAATLTDSGNACQSLGQYSQAIAYHEQSLTIKRDIGDRSGEAKALGNLGVVYYSLGQYSQAIAYHQQSLTIKRDIGDRSGEAKALGNLGIAYYSLGQYSQAIAYHQQSLAITFEVGDRRGEAGTLGNLGAACSSLGQYSQAIAYLEQTLAIARDIGDRSGEAKALGGLGNAYQLLGRYSQAIACHEQYLAIARDIGDRSGEAQAIGNLGVAYDSLGQYSQAIAYHEQSLTIARDIGDRAWEAETLGNLGVAYQSLGQYSQAIAYHEQYLAIARDIGDRRGEAQAIGNLGAAYGLLGQYSQAIAYQEQWLAIAREIGDRSGEAASLGNLGLAYRALGQYSQAIAYHKQSLAIARDIGDRRGEANSLGNLGVAYDSLGQYSQAIAYHEQSLTIARDIGDRSGEANSLGNLGVAYKSLGQYSQAIAYHEQHLAIARDIGERFGEAASLGNLGVAYDSLGQYSQAIAYYEQSLAIARDIGYRSGEAKALGNLGNAYDSLGQYSQAIALYHECIEIMRAIGDRRGEARNLQNLGAAYQRCGRVQEGMAASQQAAQVMRELGLPLEVWPLPRWVKAIVRFGQRGKWQVAVCLLVGLVAFPFALVAFIAIFLWRLAVGRFRR